MKTFAISREKLSFTYTGDTVVGRCDAHPRRRRDPTGGRTPGDLSLAQAAFDLQPTFTATPFRYAAAVTAAGGSSTPATALPGDLWRIAVSVPAANGYWKGPPAAAENLLATDTARCADVDGKHLKTSNGASSHFEIDCELDDGERELGGELTVTLGTTFRSPPRSVRSGSRARAGGRTSPASAPTHDRSSPTSRTTIPPARPTSTTSDRRNQADETEGGPASRSRSR